MQLPGTWSTLPLYGLWTPLPLPRSRCPELPRVVRWPFILPGGFLPLRGLCVLRAACNPGSVWRWVTQRWSHPSGKKVQPQHQCISLWVCKLTVGFCLCGWVAFFLAESHDMGSYFPVSLAWKLAVFNLGQPAKSLWYFYEASVVSQMLSMFEIMIILVFWHKYKTVMLHFIGFTVDRELDLLHWNDKRFPWKVSNLSSCSLCTVGKMKTSLPGSTKPGCTTWYSAREGFEDSGK